LSPLLLLMVLLLLLLLQMEWFHSHSLCRVYHLLLLT
jgi:hypothetical protein